MRRTIRGARFGRSEGPVGSRAALVGPRGSDEAPLYRAAPQGPAEPRAATRASERARGLRPGLLGLGFGLSAVLLAAATISCAQPECVVPDYTDPECRVIAENDAARLDLAVGAELRFLDPSDRSGLDWEALGLLREPASGALEARVATLGDFALGVRGAPEGALSLDLELSNVDPSTVLSLGPPDGGVELGPATDSVLRRRLEIEVGAGEELELRGRLPCPERFQLAFVGDIQTNPLHFERIIERLREDVEASRGQGEPILGLVLVGDLTEASSDDEFATIQRIVAASPVPVAVTPGNHDIVRAQVPIYNSTFGPGSYAFEVCGARVALLDSGTARLARSIQGRLPELFRREGADFLIAATHYPLYSGLSGDGWSREDQPQLVLAELALAEADLIVAGHMHALRDDPDVNVGGQELRQIIVGTGGADQGLGVARFGYVRVGLVAGEPPRPCFVEVPPPGWASPPNQALPTLPYCDA